MREAEIQDINRDVISAFVIRRLHPSRNIAARYWARGVFEKYRLIMNSWLSPFKGVISHLYSDYCVYHLILCLIHIYLNSSVRYLFSLLPKFYRVFTLFSNVGFRLSIGFLICLSVSFTFLLQCLLGLCLVILGHVRAILILLTYYFTPLGLFVCLFVCFSSKSFLLLYWGHLMLRTLLSIPYSLESVDSPLLGCC